MSLQELKEHKRAVEKLGRKQKDEVDRRTKELRERHAAELSRLKSQLEVCNTVTEAENFGTGNRHSTISGGETGPGAEGISLYGPQETRSKQKSKSQRRREAKAAHEAEREARILAEKEAQGPTERALEEERLMGLLLPLSLSIKEVPADGHCMYRALQDQLLSVPDGEEEAVSGGYEGLRRLAAMHMRKHADEYIPFVVEADEGEQCYEQFENYCKEIENTAAWGGQAELGALANALRRHIEVYSADLGCLEMGTDYKGVKHTLRLCYMRHAYGLGEHYNSVVIASGTSLKVEPEL